MSIEEEYIVKREDEGWPRQRDLSECLWGSGIVLGLVNHACPFPCWQPSDAYTGPPWPSEGVVV